MRSLPFLLLLAPFALAQPVPVAKDGKVTVPLDLSPAATPKPLSAYYLEAEYAEKQPGEKLCGFLKCFMEQDIFFNQENQKKRLDWLALPLKDLPDDVRKQAGVEGGIAYKSGHAGMMAFADQAARYTHTEWNEYFNLRRDGIYFLLPEVQKLRALAHALHLRMRAEVKAGEFDKGLVSARTLFGLARMLETHPTMISNLVGIAVAAQAVNALEEMVAQPKCPNLYWSFADLPTPFLSIRQGVSGERLFVGAQFGRTIPADRAMTDKEITAVIDEVRVLQGVSGESPGPLEKPAVKYAALTADDKRLDAIRERLTKAGTSAEVVKAMPKLQLVLLEDLHRYEVTRDEIFKWMNHPHPEAAEGLKEADKLAKDEKAAGWVLGPIFLPAVQRVKGAQARLDQRLAYLKAVEAVRLYAHETGGKLPEKLSDLKVPEPLDPISGKGFTYTLKDGVATLTGKNPTGMETDNRVYELRLRK